MAPAIASAINAPAISRRRAKNTSRGQGANRYAVPFVNSAKPRAAPRKEASASLPELRHRSAKYTAVTSHIARK